METVARLQHPHILTVLDSGEAARRLWFTMPYVEGESLRVRLTRERQLPIEDALRIVEEVAEALGYAHQQDVVHRDIKPENIPLSDGHAFVADFGIARTIETVGGERLRGGISAGEEDGYHPSPSPRADRGDHAGGQVTSRSPPRARL
ncbi:MAG TPA: protein kinase [Gemmatimonadales bacterium]|nr:protein kinase [Gemmatimonadales bacterium]